MSLVGIILFDLFLNEPKNRPRLFVEATSVSKLIWWNRWFSEKRRLPINRKLTRSRFLVTNVIALTHMHTHTSKPTRIPTRTYTHTHAHTDKNIITAKNQKSETNFPLYTGEAKDPMSDSRWSEMGHVQQIIFSYSSKEQNPVRSWRLGQELIRIPRILVGALAVIRQTTIFKGICWHIKMSRS